MNDQAGALRRMVENIKKQRSREVGRGARIVCVTSGKGGVGKTNITVNLAISLVKKGLRVLIIDSDFGLANVDVVMGVTPQYDLSQVIRHEIDIKDAIFEGPGGVKIVSGGSGVLDLINLSEIQLANLMDSLLLLDDVADVILFDTGAGVSKNILRLIAASQEIIVVTTPEPTAIMDAYALIKTIVSRNSDAKMSIIINRAENQNEAEDTIRKFISVVQLYLDTEVQSLGYIVNDSIVARAVKLQRPFILSFPKSAASRNVEEIAWKFMDIESKVSATGLRGFFSNLLNRQNREINDGL